MSTIDVKPIDTSIATEEEKQSLAIYGQTSQIVISDQPAYEAAGGLRQKIRARLKWLEETRKTITVPLDQAKKAVMDMFRVPTAKYESALVILDKAMITYDEVQESKRQQEEERLRREADKKRQEALEKAQRARAEGRDDKAEKYEDKAANIVAPSLAPTAQKPSGIQYRDHWSAEVIDFKKLPDDYKIANGPMLNTVAKATRGTLAIPGVVFKKEKIVASRASAGAD